MSVGGGYFNVVEQTMMTNGGSPAAAAAGNSNSHNQSFQGAAPAASFMMPPGAAVPNAAGFVPYAGTVTTNGTAGPVANGNDFHHVPAAAAAKMPPAAEDQNHEMPAHDALLLDESLKDESLLDGAAWDDLLDDTDIGFDHDILPHHENDHDTDIAADPIAAAIAPRPGKQLKRGRKRKQKIKDPLSNEDGDESDDSTVEAKKPAAKPRGKNSTKRQAAKKKGSGTAAGRTKIIGKDIVLNNRDAVFGRGRKKEKVRSESLYRDLVEQYYVEYSHLDASDSKNRRKFVTDNILNPITKAGGRFILRDGVNKIQLYPKESDDLRLILKKVQRALFNERKRREQNNSVEVEESPKQKRKKTTRKPRKKQVEESESEPESEPEPEVDMDFFDEPAAMDPQPEELQMNAAPADGGDAPQIVGVRKSVSAESCFGVLSEQPMPTQIMTLQIGQTEEAEASVIAERFLNLQADVFDNEEDPIPVANMVSSPPPKASDFDDVAADVEGYINAHKPQFSLSFAEMNEENGVSATSSVVENEDAVATSDEASKYLESWRMSTEHIARPYPTKEEKLQMMAATGLELEQVDSGFINNRKRDWRPKVLRRLEHLEHLESDLSSQQIQELLESFAGAKDQARVASSHTVPDGDGQKTTQDSEEDKVLSATNGKDSTKEKNSQNVVGEVEQDEESDVAAATGPGRLAKETTFQRQSTVVVVDTQPAGIMGGLIPDAAGEPSLTEEASVEEQETPAPEQAIEPPKATAADTGSGKISMETAKLLDRESAVAVVQTRPPESLGEPTGASTGEPILMEKATVRGQEKPVGKQATESGIDAGPTLADTSEEEPESLLVLCPDIVGELLNEAVAKGLAKLLREQTAELSRENDSSVGIGIKEFSLSQEPAASQMDVATALSSKGLARNLAEVQTHSELQSMGETEEDCKPLITTNEPMDQSDKDGIKPVLTYDEARAEIGNMKLLLGLDEVESEGYIDGFLYAGASARHRCGKNTQNPKASGSASHGKDLQNSKGLSSTGRPVRAVRTKTKVNWEAFAEVDNEVSALTPKTAKKSRSKKASAPGSKKASAARDKKASSANAKGTARKANCSRTSKVDVSKIAEARESCVSSSRRTRSQSNADSIAVQNISAMDGDTTAISATNRSMFAVSTLQEGSKFEGLAIKFADLLSSGGSQEGVQDLVEEACRGTEAGELVIEEASEFIQRFAKQLGTTLPIGSKAFQHFAGLDFSKLSRTSLSYYMRHEESLKTPSWKQRSHRFFPMLGPNQFLDLHNNLELAKLCYAGSVDTIKENLERMQVPYKLAYVSLQGTLDRPAHFVAVSQAVDPSDPCLEVIMCLRGTEDTLDTLPHLLCESDDYRGGKIHRRTLRCAQFLAEKHKKPFQDLLKSSGSKRIKLSLTGHGFGAGVASVLGMELAEDRMFEIKVVGFGCPAILSKDLSEQTKSYITTVVADNDCVPRLSQESLINALLDMMGHNYVPSAIRDADYLLRSLEHTFPKIMTSTLRSAIDPIFEKHLVVETQESTHERIDPILLPPGRIIHVYRDILGVAGNVVPCDFFRAMDITHRMFKDHCILSGYQPLIKEMARLVENDRRDVIVIASPQKPDLPPDAQTKHGYVHIISPVASKESEQAISDDESDLADPSKCSCQSVSEDEEDLLPVSCTTREQPEQCKTKEAGGSDEALSLQQLSQQPALISLNNFSVACDAEQPRPTATRQKEIGKSDCASATDAVPKAGDDPNNVTSFHGKAREFATSAGASTPNISDSACLKKSKEPECSLQQSGITTVISSSKVNILGATGTDSTNSEDESGPAKNSGTLAWVDHEGHVASELQEDDEQSTQTTANSAAAETADAVSSIKSKAWSMFKPVSPEMKR